MSLSLDNSAKRTNIQIKQAKKKDAQDLNLFDSKLRKTFLPPPPIRRVRTQSKQDNKGISSKLKGFLKAGFDKHNASKSTRSAMKVSLFAIAGMLLLPMNPIVGFIAGASCGQTANYLSAKKR